MWDFYIGSMTIISSFLLQWEVVKCSKVRENDILIFLAWKRRRSKSPFHFYNMWFSPQTFIRSFIVECMHFLAFFREDWVKVELSRAFKGHLIIKVVLRFLPLSRRKPIVCTSFVKDGLNVCENGIIVLLPRLHILSNPIMIIDKACLCFCLLCV